MQLRWMKNAIMMAASLPLMAAGQAPQNRVQPAMADIAYGNDAADLLDVYPAAGPGPHRFVAFLHGGWTKETKQGARLVAGPLNAAGYTVIGLEYREVPQTDIPGILHDITQAIAYVQHNAARLGVAPRPFGLIGHSAGAFQSMLLATDPSYLHAAGVAPADLAVVVALDAVYDVTANVTHYPSELRQQVFGTSPEIWRQISPIAHLDPAPHPRLCLVHDTLVPRFVEQFSLFDAALRQHGIPFDALAAEGLNHGQILQRFSDPSEPIASFALGCMKKAL